MSDFKQTQYAFINHIKEPSKYPKVAGIEDRRLKIYRELFFNNILGFISSGFPVLKSLYPEQRWQHLARQFFSEHQCRSPYFIDISKEFVEYLSNEYELCQHDPVFIQELAHYEWLELDVSVRKSTQSSIPWDGNSPIKNLQVSELASLVSYRYPVHQISAEFQPTKPSETVYLVYRDNQDEVNFSLLNTVSAFLINAISTQGIVSMAALTEQMSQAMPQLSAVQVEESLLQVVKQLLTQQVLLIAEG